MVNVHLDVLLSDLPAPLELTSCASDESRPNPRSRPPDALAKNAHLRPEAVHVWWEALLTRLRNRRAHQQHRHTRAAQNVLGHAPEHDPFEPRAPMGRHGDEVDMVSGGMIE